MWPIRRVPGRVQSTLIVALYVVGWVVLDRATVAFEMVPGVTTWYPPSALSLALLVRGGLYYAPALLIGPLVSRLWMNRLPVAPLYVLVFALIVAVGYGLAGALLRRNARIDPRLRRLRDVAWFVAVALTTSLVVALLAVADFAMARLISWPAYGSAVLNFWIGDAVGLICFAPLLLISGPRWALPQPFVAPSADAPVGRQRPAGWTVLELLGQVVITTVVVLLAFWLEPLLGLHAFYLCFLPLIWIVTRHGLPGAAVSLVAMNTGATLVFYVHKGTGSELESFQFFMLIFSLAGLFLGSIISERKRMAEGQRFLAEATALLTFSLDYETILTTVARLAVPFLGDCCTVDVLDENGAVHRVAVAHVDPAKAELLGAADRRCSLDAALDASISKVLQTGRAQIVTGAANLRLAASTGAIRDEPGEPTDRTLTASMNVPLLARGRTLGVLSLVAGESERHYDLADLALAEALAHGAALAADNARLYHEARRRLAEVTTVQRVARAINSTLRLDRVFQVVVEQISAALGYQLVSIYLCEGDGLALQASIGYDKVMSFIRLDQAVVGRAARTGQAVFVRDVRQDPDFIVVAPGTQQAIVIPFKSGDGEVLGTLLVESTGRPELTDDDFRVLMLLADQVSVAVANARLFADLRASEHRYRTLVAQAADSIFIADLEGHLLDVNEQATALLGYQREELLRMRMLDLVAPADEAQALEAFESMQRNGRVFTALRLRRQDGELLPVEINAGGVSGGIVLAIVRDVSEHQQLEAQLRQAQKLEAIGTLANGIAHDFNNLLSAITGYASLILEDTPLADPKREELEQILRAARRGSGLTRQLLAFSRPTATERQSLDFTVLAQDALRLLRPTIPSTITITSELEERMWKVEADPAQLQQVIVNLVVNARDALPEGGAIQIATANVVLDSLFCERHLGAQPGRYGQLSVTDNGIGMEEAVLNRIFEPFFTTKEAGRGTGLGLAITHSIVRGHGGVIDVISRLGQGTTVAIYMPAIAEEEPALDQTKEIDAPRGRSELILVVDDEPEVRYLAQRILERYGYQTLVAEDGRSAIAAYEAHGAEIGAVMLDLTMPELDGRATFHALRAIDPTVPVIFCSGQSSADLVAQLAAPSTTFLAKPYSIAELTRAVAQVLRTAKRAYSY